ncbi:glycerophosphoryl diester phosphodiesterase [Halothece sp. PCC 7418]|uniref:glycerophosphodiester phosphodiesterase n=1 Tax=Halothece sp. (strain PCC 7418) TaxID=65093 RepID=UPI0002A0720C|nr:glycerophosphodiester phosphodiesterase family protein [Halothece sp. PCC 7418]AFZ42335.1 glycerophosphoryl diester phosphodiesterase [Halothece sp. PCC 7418]
MTNLIAHRGYSAIAPENTLASFQSALEQPIIGVEFDVHLSRDGVPVVIHDATVDRTTNGQGNVATKTVKELQSLDAGSWFDPRFSQETIPTLSEVLELFASSNVHLYIELKYPQTWSFQGANHLITLLETWRDRCTIISFDHKFITSLREQFPECAIGYGIADPSQYTEDYLATLNLNHAAILPHFSLVLTSPYVTSTCLRQDPIEIIPWTVDEIAVAEKLADFNLNKMISNTLLQESR